MFTAAIAAHPEVIKLKSQIKCGEGFVRVRAIGGQVPGRWTERLEQLRTDLSRLEENLYQAMKDHFHETAEY